MLPAVANAQSLEVSLSLSPLVNPGDEVQTLGYVPPDQATPIYVYATVTGPGAVNAAGNLDGLQYLYYNVNAQVSSGSTGGIISSAVLAPGFTGGAHVGGAGTNGAQNGLVGSTAYTSATSIALGSLGTTTTLMSNIAKPRASAPIWSTGTTGTGNIIINGDSVTFLVETLSYTPSFSIQETNSGPLNSTQFSLSIPSLAGLQYAPDNYFIGSGTTTTSSNTYSTGYYASSNKITVTEVEDGDDTLDGQVDSDDFGPILNNFNTAITGWVNGNMVGESTVDSDDFGPVLNNFNTVYGPAPVFVAAPGASIGDALSTAQIAGGGTSSVPEPASIGLLAVGGLSLLSRRRSRS
jgi:hypothetical protein